MSEIDTHVVEAHLAAIAHHADELRGLPKDASRDAALVHTDAIVHTALELADHVESPKAVPPVRPDGATVTDEHSAPAAPAPEGYVRVSDATFVPDGKPKLNGLAGMPLAQALAAAPIAPVVTSPTAASPAAASSSGSQLPVILAALAVAAALVAHFGFHVI